MNRSIPFTSAVVCTDGAGAKAGRNRVLSLMCVLAFAIAAMVIIPSGASALAMNEFTYTNATGTNAAGTVASPGVPALQASGHPNASIMFTRNGSESEDLKDVYLDLPVGVFANPEAPLNGVKCSSSQFNADTCPLNSHVGTVTTSVKALGLLDLDIHGTIDLLQPDANQVATLGLSLRPEKICIIFVFCAQPNKIFLKTGITVNSFDGSNLRTYTAGTPKTAVIGIPILFVTPTITGDITINRLKLDFLAKAGTEETKRVCTGWFGTNCSNVTTKAYGSYFFRQAGNCSVPATATATIVDVYNHTATKSASYTPTGCANVQHNTTFGFTVNDKRSLQPSSVKFELNVPEADKPIQDALPKVVDNDFPLGSGIELSELDGVTACTEPQLVANTCPASSVIGNASAFSKYLPGPNASTAGLIGPVYAMPGIGNQVPIAVRLLGARNTVVIFRGTLGIRGDAELGTGRAYARFDRIPDLPFTKFTLDLTKKLYKNPPTCTTATTTASIEGFNGNVKSLTASYTPTDCATAPVTTITNAPPTTQPTTDNTPSFSFTSSIAGSTFKCKLNDQPEETCTSPYTSTELPNNPSPAPAYTFSVTAYNGLTPGNTATTSFRVNTSNSFVITPVAVTPSTSQAAAHPNLLADIDVDGGQPKTLKIRMPRGFAASLAVKTPCAVAVAAAGNCTAASQIGSGSMTVDSFLGSQTGTGDIFLTEGPTGADAGGLAAKFTFPGLGNGVLIAQAGAYIVENARYQEIEFREIPTEIGTYETTVTNLTVNFTGTDGFLTNASNCDADNFVSSGTAYDGTPAAAVTSPYQATGCGSVAFAPTVNQVLSNPTANALTGVVANINLPANNGTIRTLRVVEPPSLGPAYGSFGQSADMCPAASAPTAGAVFNPASCPAAAKVGTMTINTPLLTTPLVGEVYLINKTPLPWFGVKFDQPGISFRLTGITSLPQVDPTCDETDLETNPEGFCQSQISVVFGNVPDTPLTSVVFDLNGPARAGSVSSLPGELLKVAEPGSDVCATGPAKSTTTAWSGQVVTADQPIAINGC